MKNITTALIIALLLPLTIILAGCINDEFTTSPNDVLTFSVDTVAFDTVITGDGTPTKQFVVYNRSKKQINISSIRVAGESEGHFFLNVDGTKGEVINDIEIRGEDSIFVFVESRLDPTGKIEPIEIKDHIEFVTNGVTQRVGLHAWAQDAIIFKNLVLTEDTKLMAGIPYIVYDTLLVSPGVTLTLEPGSQLLFHDKAVLRVQGRLHAVGTQQQPINLRGDRLDHVVGEIDWDIMSGQWDGIVIDHGSYGNEMAYVYMRSTTNGINIVSGDPVKPSLHILNSVLHNATNNVMTVLNAWIEAEGTEFSDAGNDVIQLTGGRLRLNNCTLANFYLFNAIKGPLIELARLNEFEGAASVIELEGDFNNCIFYGNCDELNAGDLSGTNVYLRYCLIKNKGSDDANFINCVWGADPKFYLERDKYIFDYRLKPESDAIGKGNRALTPDKARYDRYGNDRFAAGDYIDLGAYVFVAPPATE